MVKEGKVFQGIVRSESYRIGGGSRVEVSTRGTLEESRAIGRWRRLLVCRGRTMYPIRFIQRRSPRLSETPRASRLGREGTLTLHTHIFSCAFITYPIAISRFASSPV